MSSHRAARAGGRLGATLSCLCVSGSDGRAREAVWADAGVEQRIQARDTSTGSSYGTLAAGLSGSCQQPLHLGAPEPHVHPGALVAHLKQVPHH